MTKKNTTLSVRVDEETEKIVRSLAQKDDRTMGYNVRQLVDEALKARGLIKPKKK